jgi:hypothetical protein
MVRLMTGQQATIAPLIPNESRFWRARRPVKAAALYYQRANNTLF